MLCCFAAAVSNLEVQYGNRIQNLVVVCHDQPIDSNGG